MTISVEISYYPLSAEYSAAVTSFIDALASYPDVDISPGPMSTIVTGEAHAIFGLLETEVVRAFDAYPAVFTVKIANACPV